MSLRNLSVVLRQLFAKDAEERKKFCFDGLQMAKEAVHLDSIDSQSWLILGNSYLAVTFYSSHNSGCLKKALAAYSQAEKYGATQIGFNSADLFYNKAAALIFDEQFQLGLENLERARTLDPSWDLPGLRKESTLQMLRSLSAMVALKGRLKTRKLNLLLKVNPPFLALSQILFNEWISGKNLACLNTKLSDQIWKTNTTSWKLTESR